MTMPERPKLVTEFAQNAKGKATVPSDRELLSSQLLPDSRGDDDLLGDVHEFLGRFVAYPSEHAQVAHTLWIAHTWLMDCWDSTPRIAFLSPEPGSGKSRCLEVTGPLVPRPVHAVNVSTPYLFRKISDDAGLPTILYDECDTVFGSRTSSENEDVRGLLNAGHRKGATAGRCAIVGKTVVTEDWPVYCAVAMAGLNDLPDTLMSRSVVVRMRRRAPSERVEPWRARLNEPEAEQLAERLSGWAASVKNRVTWPDMPNGIEDRNADIWEALLAVADVAGGEWPERARVSAVSLVSLLRAANVSLGVMLLRDLRVIFAAKGVDRISTEDLLDSLHKIEESPWSELRGKPLDPRGLARYLGKYEVKPKQVRIGERTLKGYELGDLLDPFSRYLPSLPIGGRGIEGDVDGDVDRSSAAPRSETAETGETNHHLHIVAPPCPDCEFPLDSDEHGYLCEECA